MLNADRIDESKSPDEKAKQGIFKTLGNIAAEQLSILNTSKS
jgi:hypothetical protein